MRRYDRAFLAIALVALLVTSPVGAAATASQPGVAPDDTQEDDETERADEAYVEDDGDVVLVYREQADDDSGTGHVGVNLSEGLFHVFVTDTMEERPDGNFTGNASFVLGPDSLTADGAFSMTRPESLDDLTFDASATRTREESSASVSLDATVRQESAESGSSYESLSTEGSMTTTGSSFSTEGSVVATFSEGQSLPARSRMHQEFTLRETDDAYVLTAVQNYTVGVESADNWSTRDDARRSLESRFESVARGLEGNASVAVDSYSFDDETNRLNVRYTVEFTGVDEAVSERLAASLSSSRDLNLSESEARDLAERIESVEVTELSGTVDVEAREVSANWTVRIDSYDEAATATFEVLEASEVNVSRTEIADARSRFEARQAADLRRTVTWEGSFAQGTDDAATVRFSAEYATENWQAYVRELDDRNVEWPGNSTFDAHAETREGELTANVSATFGQEDLVDTAVESMLEGTDAGREPADDDPQSRAVLRAFQQSEFERARADVAVSDGNVTVEAAASFDNLTAVRDAIREESDDDATFTRAFSEFEGEETVTYVRLRNAVGSDASESDVRALSSVGEDTEVHLPGDWDPSEKTFPELDTEETNEFLGIDGDDGGSGDDGGDGESSDEASSSSLPGFGPAVALLALVAFALFARRSAGN